MNDCTPERSIIADTIMLLEDTQEFELHKHEVKLAQLTYKLMLQRKKKYRTLCPETEHRLHTKIETINQNNENTNTNNNVNDTITVSSTGNTLTFENKLQELVFAEFQKIFSAQYSITGSSNGVNVKDVYNKFAPETIFQVNKAINALNSEGFIYSTIDDNHYKPTMD